MKKFLKIIMITGLMAAASGQVMASGIFTQKEQEQITIAQAFIQYEFPGDAHVQGALDTFTSIVKDIKKNDALISGFEKLVPQKQLQALEKGTLTREQGFDLLIKLGLFSHSYKMSNKEMIAHVLGLVNGVQRKLNTIEQQVNTAIGNYPNNPQKLGMLEKFKEILFEKMDLVNKLHDGLKKAQAYFGPVRKATMFKNIYGTAKHKKKKYIKKKKKLKKKNVRRHVKRKGKKRYGHKRKFKK